MANDDLDVREIYKSRFIVGEDLDGKEHTCTIRKVGLQALPADDGEMENKIKLALSGFAKPLVLCKKEATKLARLMGTSKARDWVGGVITIYPMSGRFFGQQQLVPRLRDRAQKPQARRDDEPPPREPGED